MSMRMRRTTSIILLMLIAVMLLSFSACEVGTLVQWIDADGELILEERYIVEPSDLLERDLPEDNSRWHYTGWREVKTRDKDTRIIALEGVRRREHVWRGLDGTVIKRETLLDTDTYVNPKVPASTAMWSNLGWVKDIIDDDYVHTIKRVPKIDYFRGNVFQINAYKNDGITMSLGTGFVIDSSGLFITNEHVMNDSYTATAIFYLGDEGSQRMTLGIDGGIEMDKSLDIFVGRISNYEMVAKHYSDIGFETTHTKGDNAYALGYPNGVTKLSISSGKISDDVANNNTADRSDYYIVSSAKVAEGSSGGVLLNDSLKVIGITTIGVFNGEDMSFVSGYAVPARFFVNMVNRAKTGKVIPLRYIYPSVA